MTAPPQRWWGRQAGGQSPSAGPSAGPGAGPGARSVTVLAAGITITASPPTANVSVGKGRDSGLGSSHVTPSHVTSRKSQKQRSVRHHSDPGAGVTKLCTPAVPSSAHAHAPQSAPYLNGVLRRWRTRAPAASLQEHRSGQTGGHMHSPRALPRLLLDVMPPERQPQPPRRRTRPQPSQSAGSSSALREPSTWGTGPRNHWVACHPPAPPKGTPAPGGPSQPRQHCQPQVGPAACWATSHSWSAAGQGREEGGGSPGAPGPRGQAQGQLQQHSARARSHGGEAPGPQEPQGRSRQLRFTSVN